MPLRARSTRCGLGPAAEEEKRDTISFRPAGRSAGPFLSRNYEIASLKDPHRAPFSLFSFPSASLPVVSRHPSTLPQLSRPLATISPLPFFSASSRNRQRIIPSSLLDYLSPSLRPPFAPVFFPLRVFATLFPQCFLLSSHVPVLSTVPRRFSRPAVVLFAPSTDAAPVDPLLHLLFSFPLSYRDGQF